MKLSFLLELLFIFIIIAFAASKPLNSDLRLKTIKSGLVARQDFSTQSPAPANVDDDDDDDDDDDSFGLGDDDDDDEDDDDDDDDESGQKQKEPEDTNKPTTVDSDEDDDILGFDDEKDASSEEDDIDGEELLLFGDELLGFLTEDDEPKPILSTAAVTASAIQPDQVNQPVAEASPGHVNKNKPIETTPSLSPQASGPLLPSFASDALNPIIPQSNYAHTPALLELSQMTQPDLVHGDLNKNKPIHTAPIFLPQISEPVLPSLGSVSEGIIPEYNFAHSPALFELSQIAQSNVINGDDIKTNKIPQTANSNLELIGNTVPSSESSLESETSLEVIKAEGAQDSNDESLEEEGMIVVSDTTLAENNKKPENEQIVTNTNIKHDIANAEGNPPKFQNDKDMEIVGQIPEIAEELPSTSAVISTKPPKTEDGDEAGLLGIVDSLISDEDIEDDDDDDVNIEDEGDKVDEDDDDDDDIDDDEDNEIAALEEASSEGTTRKDKKKKKSPGVINRIGQTLGLVRGLKAK